MQEITQIYRNRGSEFIDDLFNDYLVVTEKLSGSSFSFCKSNDTLQFFKGNGQRPINLIDRTLMMYYESPIQYIRKVTAPILLSLPENWTFCFQYFVHNEPGIIKYDRLPKNNLVLTHILVKGNSGKVAKVIDDPRVISDWATKLNVTPLKPIFLGYLTKEQKNKIKEFISLPIEDQEELFGTRSFASYLINLLGSSNESTTLQNDLSKPIDSIVFKFYKPGTKETFAAKLIDPYTRSLMKEREPVDIRRAPADINQIILLDILAFLEERGLKKHEVLTATPEERYLELVSAIFNDYVQKRGNDVKNLNFEKADFANLREFDLNTDLIMNKKTKELVNSSESLKDLYKVMLGSLRKKRNPDKPGPVLTPTVIESFNEMIDKIADIVKTDNVDSEFKTFNDYLNIKNTNENLFTQDDLQDLISEDLALNFSEFINLNKVDLGLVQESYAKLTKKQTNWVKGYEKFAKSTNWIKPKSKITGEYLRAEFGMNDGTAESQIENYLLKVIGIKRNEYSIEQITKGTYVSDAGGKISSDYDSYAITILKPVTDAFGDSYKKGDTLYITNRVKISSSGEAAVIGKKDLTPDAMKLPLNEYKNAQSLYSAVEKYIRGTQLPDNYKDFILQSSMQVVNNQKNNGKYDDFEDYANNKEYLFYDIEEALFKGIDPISINNFQNDYGEVLGGFMLFNLLKDTGNGLSYPTASNEKLVDFYFDGYSVSSKAGSGGTPTGDTIIQKINSSYESGNLTFDTIEEQDFYNNVVKQWVNPPKLERSGTYNNIMNLCNVNIADKNSSGYWYILDKVNVQPNNATRDAIVSYLDTLSEDEAEFKKVMKEFFTKSGIDQSRLGMDRVYPAYIKQKNANDKNRIGFVFYPLMVEATNVLNDKYQKQLTKYGQMVTDIKQLYLDVQVNKGQFRFKTVPFKSASFMFEQKGAIPNPFNSNMGIKIKK